MILTPAEMKAAEEAVFARGIGAEDLMEKAGRGIAEAVRDRWPKSGTIVAYLGRGHNAGDALVAGRHLRRWGWQMFLREVAPPEKASSLTQKKRVEFLATGGRTARGRATPLVLMDALLGIGASGPLRADYQTLTREINARRETERAHVVAIDIPTGVNGESGEIGDGSVRADVTLSIACAKTGLLEDAATNHVGELTLIALPEILPPSGGACSARVLTTTLLASWLRRRQVDDYKNRAGHVCLFAGSTGLTGAAAMASAGALAAGAGLVSLYVPGDIYPILATRCAPEIMVTPLPDTLTAAWLAAIEADVFAVGPGLGRSPPMAYLEWLQGESRPGVIDADGLNLMAGSPGKRRTIADAGPRLVTPHPGEFARLFPEYGDLSGRRQRAEAVVSDFPLTLLYKGARTIIAHQAEPTSYNLSGNPGMATGGMGDVLTGVCAGLAAQGYALPRSACLGAWLCGRSADVAIRAGATHETLRTTDVIEHLAPAFRELA